MFICYRIKGKEIGEYIQIKRHYHTSTDIRKKLGLKEDDTNLGASYTKSYEETIDSFYENIQSKLHKNDFL